MRWVLACLTLLAVACGGESEATPTPTPTVVQPTPLPGNTYYANCDAARAAGATPLYRTDPAYRPALDGNGDGIACEEDR